MASLPTTERSNSRLLIGSDRTRATSASITFSISARSAPVRAVAWTQTARPTLDSGETVYEALRILDNFNLPLGGAEGSGAGGDIERMRSSTIWTTVWDLDEGVLYFHTQHNRRLRKVGLGGVDFSGDEIRHIPLDDERVQDIENLTPGG